MSSSPKRSRLLHKRSATSYVIEALIPLTDANLTLTFSPRKFFRELAETSDSSAERLERAYYRAKRSGIVQYVDGHFAIDPDYLDKLYYHSSEKLPDGQTMLVMYDIPESSVSKRRALRDLLRELGFTQIQKSVWQTENNHLEPVLAIISKLAIISYVQVFVGTTEFDQYMISR